MLKTTMLDCKQTDEYVWYVYDHVWCTTAIPHIKRTQLRWFGNMTRMSPGQTCHLPGQLSQVYAVGRSFQGRHRECRKDYMSVQAKIPW